MVDRQIPYPEAGLAAFEQLDNYSAGLLISGSFPPLAPGYPLPIGAGVELAQFAVVGLSGGNLVMATNAIKPVGVLTQHVIGDADGGTTVDIFFSGCFNPAMLVWHADFNTDAKKVAAFMGSPSPTQILIRARG